MVDVGSAIAWATLRSILSKWDDELNRQRVPSFNRDAIAAIRLSRNWLHAPDRGHWGDRD